MAHMDAARNSSVLFGKLVDNPFPGKGVSFLTLSFVIPPLFGLKFILVVYGMFYYCCVVVLWRDGVLLAPPYVSLGLGGCVGGDLISNWSYIFSICM